MVEQDLTKPLTYGRIFRFWAPLASTWLMMAVEGPFLAAIIARLAAPTENLAAFGIAVAFALMIESPVIMLLSAATALVKDKTSYLALRRFTYTLNAALTAILVVVLIPPLFRVLTGTLLNLPSDVAELTHGALILLLPWPGAIGYRRFLQGTLVRHDMTERVAYGTVVRITSMALGAGIGVRVFGLAGAHVGALALSVGVVAEALASRLMARGIVSELLAGRRESETPETLTLSGISTFYFPLATMSVLAMAVHPMLTFGLSYQEVTIALMGDHAEHLEKLRNFAIWLALTASVGFGFLVFTPLAGVWFRSVAGLPPELAALALTPARIAVLLPALTVLISFQRSLLVSSRLTRPLTGATLVEVTSIAVALSVAIFGLDIMGAVGAISALVLGRLVGNAYLASPCFEAVRRLRAR